MAKWMWYPGDYECYHSLLLHGRRDEYDWKHPAFWRLDDKVEALQKRMDELEAARQKTDEAK